MCFIEVDDLALNALIQIVYYVFYPIKLGKHKSLQIHYTNIYFKVGELLGLM